MGRKLKGAIALNLFAQLESDGVSEARFEGLISERMDLNGFFARREAIAWAELITGAAREKEREREKGKEKKKGKGWGRLRFMDGGMGTSSPYLYRIALQHAHITSRWVRCAL